MAVLCLILYILVRSLAVCFALVLYFMGYLYYIHKINDHLPGPPRSSFILGHLPEIWKYKATTGGLTIEFVLEKRLEHGPILILFFLHRPVVFLGDATYLRHVFINNHASLVKNSFNYEKFGFVYGERGIGYGLISNSNEALERFRFYFHYRYLNQSFGQSDELGLPN